MSLPVAILAGGRATRLRSTTERIPKSLLDVAGRPFAVRQIQLLRDHGLADIVFLVGHLGRTICDTLGDGVRWGVHLRYVFDGQHALGTGGAVGAALPLLGDSFFVLYGDAYLECDYAAIERAFVGSGKNGLMTVYKNDGRWDSSNVLFADGRIARYDKQDRTPDMRHIDYGLGVFRKAAFVDWSDGERFDLAAVYSRLLERDDLAGYEVATRFYEIGSPAGLEETRHYLADEDASVR